MALASVNICSPKSSTKSCRTNGSNSTVWAYSLSNSICNRVCNHVPDLHPKNDCLYHRNLFQRGSLLVDCLP
eukprot:876871-Ditylum_brightwellii.AAC.1